MELGSSVPIGEGLNRVEKKMKGVSNEYDREPPSSAPRAVCWLTDRVFALTCSEPGSGR